MKLWLMMTVVPLNTTSNNALVRQWLRQLLIPYTQTLPRALNGTGQEFTVAVIDALALYETNVAKHTKQA
jgi:hypothetical protein